MSSTMSGIVGTWNRSIVKRDARDATGEGTCVRRRLSRNRETRMLSMLNIGVVTSYLLSVSWTEGELDIRDDQAGNNGHVDILCLVIVPKLGTMHTPIDMIVTYLKI